MFDLKILFNDFAHHRDRTPQVTSLDPRPIQSVAWVPENRQSYVHSPCATLITLWCEATLKLHILPPQSYTAFKIFIALSFQHCSCIWSIEPDSLFLRLLRFDWTKFDLLGSHPSLKLETNGRIIESNLINGGPNSKIQISPGHVLFFFFFAGIYFTTFWASKRFSTFSLTYKVSKLNSNIKTATSLPTTKSA